ncbi:YcnI family protein [Actinoplanes sp. CA-054009]
MRVTRAGAVALAIGLIGVASPASAHVSVTPSTTAAGAHAVLQFSVGHGCGDSPTTAITVQIPAQITSVTPTRTALWTVTKKTEKVDPPATDHHGNKIVERVASVTYRTGTPLPDGYREVFELGVQLPDTQGVPLRFPTIQTCERGEAAWTEVPQTGQTVEELESPAPGFVLSAPSESEHHHAAPASAPAPSPQRADPLTLAALAAGLLGSVLGGAALLGQRRRR